MTYLPLRATVDNNELITASPNIVCIWESDAVANTTEGLIGGPWNYNPRPRTREDLVDIYRGWVDAGRPAH